MGQVPEAALPIGLREMAEADAPPGIREIYREICILSGVAVPALIWRHLATHTGVLDAAWLVLQPLFASGVLQHAAQQACARSLHGETSSVTPAKLREVRLAPEVERAYGRVLESYNRANPINAVAVRVLLAAMKDGASDGGAPMSAAMPAWTPPAPIGDLPAMTAPADIRVVERQQINRLAALPGIDRTRVVPSLYRHLVAWPALIRLIHNDIEPRIRSGEVPALIDRLTLALDAEVERLRPHIPAMQRRVAVPGLEKVMAQFAGGLIPEMIVIGHLLRNGLDAAN